MTKLLPCPFCGGAPKNTEYFGNYNKPDWVVHCATCDLSLEGDPTPEEAARRWNTRSGSNAQAPQETHGDGYCGCTERCRDRDNCQYDVKPAQPATHQPSTHEFIQSKHGQFCDVCGYSRSEALQHGPSLPSTEPAQTPHNLPFHDETVDGLNSLTIRPSSVSSTLQSAPHADVREALEKIAEWADLKDPENNERLSGEENMYGEGMTAGLRRAGQFARAALARPQEGAEVSRPHRATPSAPDVLAPAPRLPE